MKVIVGVISALFSQIFFGLIFGMLWNYIASPLGFTPLPMLSACAIWGLVLGVVIMLTYVIANVAMSVIEYYRRLALAELMLTVANKPKIDSENS